MSTPLDPNTDLPDPAVVSQAQDVDAREETQALGGVAMRGMMYFTIATIAMKVATMLAQIVLGWKLTAEDWGIYSTATAIAGFLMVCREAGVRELLVQKGPDEYEDLVGPGFWLAFWYNTLAAVIISLLAYPIAKLLEAPIMAPILLCLAWALPLGTLGGILQTGMRVKLMFRQFSGRATAAGLFRQGTTIGFAYGGFGVMSLAWPVLLTGLFESVSAYITLPEKLWKRKMEVSRWGKILRESRWAMFASLSNFAVDWGPFLTLPLLTTATKAMQGYFAFAWNITAQLGILLSWGMMFILTPVFARMNDDPKRQADAVIRAMRAVMMIGSAGCMALGAMMAPTEHLLWHGKWEQTVFAVVLLGAFFPWRITFGLTAALLQAQGRFKLYAVLTLAEGLGLTIAVTAAAAMDPRADSMAWGAGLWLLVSRLAVCVYVFGRMGISVRAVLGSTLPAWTIALIASAAAIAVDHFFMEPALVSDDPRKSFSPQLVDIVRVIATGGITSLLCLVGMRVVLKRHIEDALSLVPVQMQLVARKVLLLPAVKASQ